MAPSLQKDPHAHTHTHMSLEKRHSSSATTLAHQPTDQSPFMIPSTVHTHMYASVVNAEAAAEAARQALRTAEAVATKAAEAADHARQSAATAVAAEEQALRDVALCKAAAAIAVEHHASTVRNLLQLPRPQADPKGDLPIPVSSAACPAPSAPPAAAAAPASRALDGNQNRQDALAIAAATAVARACIQQHMDREGGAAVSQGLPSKAANMDWPPVSEAPQRASTPVQDHSPVSQEYSRKFAEEAGQKPTSGTGKSVLGPDGQTQDQSRPPDIQAAAAATLLALSEAAGTGRTHSAQSHSKPQQQKNTTGSEPEISDALAVAAAAAIANAYSKRHNASPPPQQQQPVAPATSSTPGTPGRTHTDGVAAQLTPTGGAAADGTSPQIERKRSRSDYMLSSAAAKAARTASVSASLPGIPSRAYTSTPPPAPRPVDGSPGNSAAIKPVLSADDVTADTVVDAGDADTGTVAPRQVPYGMQEGPQALGASAQALISREAWLNEAANYPQHTLAHLPPITILPEAPIASSLALLCRKPAEAEMSAARSKLERVIAGLADVQDAFPYKMESSIYKAFSRELLWFIKTVARSCGFVDRQRLFSPKKLLLRSMSFWRACLAASGADAQHIFFLRDSYLMLIVPGLWVQARVAEGNTPEAPPPGASLLQLRGELLKQSKLFVGFAKNFHRLVPECARPVFAVFAPSTEGVMPELLK